MHELSFFRIKKCSVICRFNEGEFSIDLQIRGKVGIIKIGVPPVFITCAILDLRRNKNKSKCTLKEGTSWPVGRFLFLNSSPQQASSRQSSILDLEGKVLRGMMYFLPGQSPRLSKRFRMRRQQKKQPDVTPRLRHQAATARVRRVAGPPTTRKNN